MVEMPSIKEILQMKKVSDYGAHFPKSRQTFIDYTISPPKKYSIDSEETQKMLFEFTNAPAPAVRLQRIIRVCGRVAEERFIEGKIIKHGSLDGLQIKQLARIIFGINSAKIQNSFKKKRFLKKLRFMLRYLKTSGGFTADEKKELSKLVNKVPKQIKWALCHNDVGYDNLILKNSKLYLIDMGDMCYGPVAFELAKIFYNLNLTRKQKTAFIDWYVHFGGDASQYTKQALMWDALIALTKVSGAIHKVRESCASSGQKKKFEVQFKKRKKILLGLLSGLNV